MEPNGPLYGAPTELFTLGLQSTGNREEPGTAPSRVGVQRLAPAFACWPTLDFGFPFRGAEPHAPGEEGLFAAGVAGWLAVAHSVAKRINSLACSKLSFSLIFSR